MRWKCFIIPNFNATCCNLKRAFPLAFSDVYKFCLSVCQIQTELDKIRQGRVYSSLVQQERKGRIESKILLESLAKAKGRRAFKN